MTFEQWWSNLDREIKLLENDGIDVLMPHMQTVARGAWNAALDAGHAELTAHLHQLGESKPDGQRLQDLKRGELNAIENAMMLIDRIRA